MKYVMVNFRFCFKKSIKSYKFLNSKGYILCFVSVPLPSYTIINSVLLCVTRQNVPVHGSLISSTVNYGIFTDLRGHMRTSGSMNSPTPS